MGGGPRNTCSLDKEQAAWAIEYVVWSVKEAFALYNWVADLAQDVMYHRTCSLDECVLYKLSGSLD